MRSGRWVVEVTRRRENRPMTTFSGVFRAATAHGPYPYQEEFATRHEPPSLVSVPTGCGKAAAPVAPSGFRAEEGGPRYRVRRQGGRRRN